MTRASGIYGIFNSGTQSQAAEHNILILFALFFEEPINSTRQGWFKHCLFGSLHVIVLYILITTVTQCSFRP
jgi:hypothetical protein